MSSRKWLWALLVVPPMFLGCDASGGKGNVTGENPDKIVAGVGSGTQDTSGVKVSPALTGLVSSHGDNDPWLGRIFALAVAFGGPYMLRQFLRLIEEVMTHRRIMACSSSEISEVLKSGAIHGKRDEAKAALARIKAGSGRRGDGGSVSRDAT